MAGAVFRFYIHTSIYIGIYKTGRYGRGKLKVEDPSASVEAIGRVPVGSPFRMSYVWMKRRDSSKEAQKSPNRVGHRHGHDNFASSGVLYFLSLPREN